MVFPNYSNFFTQHGVGEANDSKFLKLPSLNSKKIINHLGAIFLWTNKYFLCEFVIIHSIGIRHNDPTSHNNGSSPSSWWYCQLTTSGNLEPASTTDPGRWRENGPGYRVLLHTARQGGSHKEKG